MLGCGRQGKVHCENVSVQEEKVCEVKLSSTFEPPTELLRT